ncbi:MAG TPA: hypothetical protein VF405_07000 [Gammaproteobacteria bacterium]
MNTLRMVTAGLLLAATAAAANAAEDQTIPTVTVTAKRHVSAPATEAPRADVEITVIMPTDMPEAEIDYHLPLVAAPPAAPGEAR